MYAILITFTALVLLRLLFERKGRRDGPQSVGTAVRAEVAAWMLAAAVLIGAYVLLFVFSLVAGPIPEIHEW